MNWKRRLVLFIAKYDEGGKYLPLLTKAYELYDEYAKITAKPATTTALAQVALETEAKRQWPDLAGQSRDGGG